MANKKTKDSQDGKELMSLNEAVDMLGTTRPTFYRWLKSGKIKGMKVGRQWRFRREEIERFLKGQEPVFEPPVSAGPLLKQISRKITEAGGEPCPGEESGEVRHLVDLIFQLALCTRASHIHIAPLIAGNGKGHVTVVRMRIDGVLQEMAEADIRLLAPIVDQWKRMTCCDLHEKARPQDGRAMLRSEGKTVDCRVSFAPSVVGESVVVRILREGTASSLHRVIEEYSLPQRKKILRHLQGASGVIAVAGPADSGKTTLLYALLLRLGGPALKLMTVENPVEYLLPWAVQAQIRPDKGVGGAAILRSFMRQDPDAVLIDEINDRDTLRVGYQVATTGRLVLAGINAPDAAGALSRMVELSGEPFIICMETKLIVAQRLARKLCAQCSSFSKPDQDELAKAEEIGSRGGLEVAALKREFRKPAGCKNCGGTGYRGMSVIAETLEISPPIREALENGAAAERLRDIALEGGMISLAADGIKKAFSGETTLREVFRAAAI